MKETHFKNSRVYIPELLKALDNTGPNLRQKRIDMLHEYASKGKDHEACLRGFIECVFHPDVKFDLPAGNPPFIENVSPDYDYSGRSLFNFFADKMPLYFIYGTSRFVRDKTRRELLFIQQLESFYKDDAQCLLMMKDKEIRGYKKFINYMLFWDAFPEWIPEPPNGQLVNE